MKHPLFLAITLRTLPLAVIALYAAICASPTSAQDTNAAAPKPAADAAAATTSGDSRAPVTLGVAQWYPTDRGEESRAAIFPELRFDGSKWLPIRDLLALPDAERATSFEPVPGQPNRRQPKSNLDVPLARMAAKASVNPSEWQQWFLVGGKGAAKAAAKAIENAPATSPIAAAGAWPAWAACRSQWALAAAETATHREFERYVASRALPAAPFVRTPMQPDDPMRRFAAAEFSKLDKGVIDELGERKGLDQIKRAPTSVPALRKFPLRWWRSFCAPDTERGGRVCQIVGRRRFDGLTQERYEVEPLEYAAWISQAANGDYQLIDAGAGLLPISDTWDGMPREPGVPHVLLHVGSRPYIWSTEQILEGQ